MKFYLISMICLLSFSAFSFEAKTIFSCKITRFSSEELGNYPAKDLYSSLKVVQNEKNKASIFGILRSDKSEVQLGDNEQDDLVVSEFQDMYYMKMLNDWNCPQYELILLKVNDNAFQGKLEVWGDDRQTYILSCLKY